MLTYVYMHNMSWGWGVLMTIGWIAVSALIIGGVVNLRRDRRSPSAAGVLDRRLATGEISVEEHQRMRAAIKSSPPASA